MIRIFSCQKCVILPLDRRIYEKSYSLYLKKYNKIILFIKKAVVWMHKMCTKLHPRDYKLFFDKYLKDYKLKFKESINSRKWQGIQPGAVIHLCKHLNTDFLMTWLGCSSPSNILGLWSRQIAHITHNGITFHISTSDTGVLHITVFGIIEEAPNKANTKDPVSLVTKQWKRRSSTDSPLFL